MANVIDAAQGLNGPADVAFTGGKVSAIGPGLDRRARRPSPQPVARRVIPASSTCTAHVYWGGTLARIDADPARPRQRHSPPGIDAWIGGRRQFPRYVASHVIETSETRILAYLNISFAGIFGLAPHYRLWRGADPELMNIEECVRVAKRTPT